MASFKTVKRYIEDLIRTGNMKQGHTVSLMSLHSPITIDGQIGSGYLLFHISSNFRHLLYAAFQSALV